MADIETKPKLVHLEDMRAKVTARRDEEAQILGTDESKPKELEPQFVLDCFRSNELGDGALFAALMRGRYVFNASSGEWLMWTGFHWKRDSLQEALSAVEDVVLTYARVVPKYVDSSALVTLHKRINRLRSNRGRKATLEAAATCADRLAIEGDELDSKPLLFPCANGVIDLETGELRPGRQEDYLMRASPVEWLSIDAPCPTWRKTVLEVMNDRKDMADFIQRYFGYCMSGLTSEHFFVVLWGRGRNGKSVVVEILKRILGPLAKPIASEMLLDQGKFGGKNASGPSPEIMGLKAVRMAFGSETDDGRRISPSRVKWLSGGDTLVGRNPHDKYEISFAPTHKLVLLTNHKPGAPADDYAFWERCLLVPFELSFVNRTPQAEFERRADPDLTQKLLTEASGILAWLVEGFLMWRRDGLKPPAAVLEATAEYRSGEDIMGEFVADCCQVATTNRVEASAFYEAFKTWWEENISKNPPAQKRFGNLMKEKFERRKVGGKYHYFGVKLLETKD